MQSGSDFRAFLVALGKHWVIVMTSSLVAVIFGAFAVFGKQPWQAVGWTVAAVIALLIGFYFVWRDERVRVLALQSKTRPIIDVFIDPKTKGVRYVDTVVFDPMQPLVPAKDGPGSLWIQLMVKSKTDAALYDCEVRALSFGSESGNISIDEPLWCRWSNVPGGNAMLIPAGVAQPVNLMSFDHHASRLIAHMFPEKAGVDKKIQNPNVFKFRIAVSARDAETVERDVGITWDGEPSHLKIEMRSV